MNRFIPLVLILLVTAFGPALAQTETAELQATLDSMSQKIAALEARDTAHQQTIDAQEIRIKALEDAPAADFILPTAADIDFAPGVRIKTITCQTTVNVAVGCDVLLLTGAYDVNGDPMTATAECPNGTHDGTIYTPKTDFTGPDSCTWSVSDGSSLAPEGPLTVTVSP